MNKSPYQILIRPIITEKAMNVSNPEAPQYRKRKGDDAELQYTFQVATSSNKREIRWAIETAYGVKVKNVNTINRKGKNRRNRMRLGRSGKTAAIKKAIVTLTPGQEIQFM